jgi:hypothetical protein
VTVRHLDIVDAARMFTAVDMSVADAEITVWHAKYVYGFWRPITAINLADTDGNPDTAPDPSWVPLFNTPNYPEYPSGYNAFNSTVVNGLENVFQTRHLQLTLISTSRPAWCAITIPAASCCRMSSTPGCGTGSTSAPRTSHPGTWAYGSPPGRLATISSPSTRNGSRSGNRRWPRAS